MSATEQVGATLAANAPDFRVALTARTHALSSDEPASSGGADAGPGPFELVLAGLASCTAITLRMYAQRKAWTLGDVHVGVSMRKEGDSRAIDRTVSLGTTLSPEQREKLAAICEKTPVTLFVKKSAPIVTRLL